MMGIGVLESVASGDENNKATIPATTPRLATPNQLKYLRSKAGEAINSEDLVEINEWLEQLLGMNPEDIVIYKVDDALAKIKAEQDSIRTTANQEYKKLEREVVVTDKDLADFDQGKIPF